MKDKANGRCSCHATVGVDAGGVGGAAAAADARCLSARSLLGGMWPSNLPFCRQANLLGAKKNLEALLGSFCKPLRLDPNPDIVARTSLEVVGIGASSLEVKVSLRLGASHVE